MKNSQPLNRYIPKVYPEPPGSTSSKVDATPQTSSLLYLTLLNTSNGTSILVHHFHFHHLHTPFTHTLNPHPSLLEHRAKSWLVLSHLDRTIVAWVLVAWVCQALCRRLLCFSFLLSAVLLVLEQVDNVDVCFIWLCREGCEWSVCMVWGRLQFRGFGLGLCISEVVDVRS